MRVFLVVYMSPSYICSKVKWCCRVFNNVSKMFDSCDKKIASSLYMYVNHHFTASITYHDSINGFQAIQGMGTTTPEVKLLQQVTAMREEELHAMFLDMYNAYNALDRYRCLDILEEYGVGPRALRLLCRYW